MRRKSLKRLVEQTVQNERRRSNREAKHKKRLYESLRRAKLILEAEEEAKGSGDFHPWVKKSLKLSQVDMEKAASALQLDSPNPEDAVKVASTQTPYTCQELKPTQSSMNLQKAVHFALGMLNKSMYKSEGQGPGGDTGAFICNKYLLDGHHRWVATCLVAPGAKVNGYAMTGVTPEDAVRVLNAATGSLMGHNVGKGGEGSFASFKKAAEIYKILKMHDTKSKKTGVPNVAGDGEATKICEKWSKGEYNHEGMAIKKAKDGPKEGDAALKWAAQAMASNAASCPGVDDGAVLLAQPRKEMPVADDIDHAKQDTGGMGNPKVKNTGEVIAALSGGGIDFKESINLNRWGKLAGLLKD